jgi:hypothetical protein
VIVADRFCRAGVSGLRSWSPGAVEAMAWREMVRGVLACASLVLALLAACPATASALPEIRTHGGNRVPACVTPGRLMQFMKARNPDLDPRFKDIAKLYKQHGEALRVRWDYAFFQMLLETNYLTYRTGSGRWGDVNPKQNNFAGIGTTGGGVPGDSFPDVSTGVLAQMQHLVAYSGEHVDNPAARRTRERQGDIIERSKALGRPVTFRDLARRWATDRRYGASIEAIAERFRAMHCKGPVVADASDDDDEPKLRAAAVSTAARAVSREAPTAEDRSKARGSAILAGAGPGLLRGPQDRTVTREAATAEDRSKALGAAILAGAGPGLLRGPQPAVRPHNCRIWTASYGGGRSVLIRSTVDGEVHYTALQVLDGFEKSLTESFIRSHAPGGEPIGEYESREAALARAFDLCPHAPRANQ